jgi:hypothetical protein
MPLIEADTAAGVWRGNPATLLAHAAGPYKGGVWASFAIPDHDWYATPEAQRVIEQAARHMAGGVFLIDGGANYYTYFENQPMTLGARVMNFGRTPHPNAIARVTLTDADTGAAAFQKEFPLQLLPAVDERVADTFTPAAWPAKGFRATVEIVEDGKVLDRTEHDVQVWKPKAKPSFITAQAGDLMLDGKRWRIHGVNYMPSSGIGTEDSNYFEYWLGARSYDPEVIDRDLDRIQDMNLNAVSIFLNYDNMKDQNLLDLLRRLDARGMKANLSLRPTTYFDFEWDKIREMIQYYHLPEQDTVFALDLAWELMFGDWAARRRFDPDWRAWTIERYGSLENAERDWAFPAPRDDKGEVTNPQGEQLSKDGPWRAMVAAYRRFLDTLLYDKHACVRRMVRSVDPNHLISFRMAEAGSPTFRWDKAIPFDFTYLAGGIDVLEPEAYARIGTEWDKVKPAWFEFEYARWASPAIPMFWAEMGCTQWVESLMGTTPERLQFQGDYFTLFYRMLISSGSDGIFYWWLPGGYRTNERSDFGIIEPDGSDRPATAVIRNNAKAFLDGPDARPIDTWIEFDRDAHPDGIAGIYDQAKDAFWQAIDAGKAPGLRTAGTGTTSADCPLLAVGDVPCNGNNPPKFLDGFFDSIEVRDAAGQWTPVPRGGAVKVRSGEPVHARIVATNLGEARWISPLEQQGAGAVYFLATLRDPARGIAADTRTGITHGQARFQSATVDDVLIADKAPAAPVEVSITLIADGRTPFGPKYKFTMVAQ